MTTAAVHLIPAGELTEHQPTAECPCKPTVTAMLGDDAHSEWLLTHHPMTLTPPPPHST